MQTAKLSTGHQKDKEHKEQITKMCMYSSTGASSIQSKTTDMREFEQGDTIAKFQLKQQSNYRVEITVAN
jgi:hypothetical protein